MLTKIICACLVMYILHRCYAYFKRLSMLDSPAVSTQSQISLKGSSSKRRHSKQGERVAGEQLKAPETKQTLDAFLVLDIEGTCDSGTNFDYPNEIIEFPVCLMRWKNMTSDRRADQLEVTDVFRSFVRPTRRPTLSEFCKNLTGITQAQVDKAPVFTLVLDSFFQFLVKNNLVDQHTGDRRVRFCWCTDGPHDIRDFIVKQCFISKVPIPEWIKGDILDVRQLVMEWIRTQKKLNPKHQCSLNISRQLNILGLRDFDGRQHSGVDDARNVARILSELARLGCRLQPNTTFLMNRRWKWMGKRGQILQEFI